MSSMIANAAQEEIIRTTEGQLIVVACPGSGKTTTLIRRIHHMIEKQIPPENILMVTFTNAAAKEMKERYRKQFGDAPVTFSTIHALCFAILRKFSGFTNNDILTDTRSYFYDKLRHVNQINDKDEFITSFLTEMSVIRNNRMDLKRYIPESTTDKKLFLSLLHDYEEYKKELGRLDYDDMLSKAYEKIQNDPDCLAWLRNRYKYIQIDEYQDTNYLQRDIMYLIAGENGNLAVVGDDDQSIYGFRGARPEIMLGFTKDYPNAKQIFLSTNYRSCSEIITTADMLIQHNRSRFKKDFIGYRKEAGSVGLMETASKDSQLLHVCAKIGELLKAGEDPSNIAILYRTNQQAEPIAELLMQFRVPFCSTEKIHGRYEHWMFRDIQAYYNLANKKGNEKMEMARILNHPNRFLYDKAFYACGLNEKKMRSAVYDTCKNNWKRNHQLDAVMDLFFYLNKLQGAEPTNFLNLLGSNVGYKDYLKDYADYRNMDVKELKNIWDAYFQDAKKYQTWKDWGRFIVMYNKKLKEAQKNRQGVVLSTMHCAKGLEWKYVFIIDCVEGMCPHKKAETPQELEEERRLFYVAMTRAKDELYLYTFKGADGTKQIRSPYLKECLPENSLSSQRRKTATAS